jgi:hypothetical protein
MVGLLIVLALVVFVLASVRWGVDSRHTQIVLRGL